MCQLLPSNFLRATQTNGSARSSRNSRTSAQTTGEAATVVRLHIGRQEYLEILYGPAGLLTGERYPELGHRVRAAEQAFHDLMAISQDEDARTSPRLPVAVEHLSDELRSVRKDILSAGLPLRPPEPEAKAEIAHPSEGPVAARSPEIQAVLTDVDHSLATYAKGEHAAARELVEETYLTRFEALEGRLPSRLTGPVERLIHLSLRPAMERDAPVAEVAEIGSASDLVEHAVRRREVGQALSHTFRRPPMLLHGSALCDIA